MNGAKDATVSSSVKDDGYTSGYIGLENNNPYTIGSKEYYLWDEGYKEALDDLDSQELSHHTIDEF